MSRATGHVLPPGPGGEPAGASEVAVRAQLRGVARGGTLNLVAAAFAGVSGLALMVAVTQTFSKAEAGVFFAATSLFLLVVSVGQLGTSTGMVYFVSRSRALHRTARIPAYVRAGAWPVVVLSLLLGAGLSGFAPQVADLTTDGAPGHLASYLRVLGVFVPVACLTYVGLSATRGLQTMRPSAYVDHIARPLLQLVLVAAVAGTAATSLLAWAWVLPFVPAAVVVWWWWRHLYARVLGRADSPGSVDDARAGDGDAEPVRVAGRFWRFTAPRALASATHMAMQRLDIVLVAALRGPAEAAVYAVATRFLVLGLMGSQAVSTAVQPRIGAAMATEDTALASRLYGTSTAWLVLVTWPVYLTLASFGPFLLGIFGDGYRGGADVLLLLSLAMLVATGCGMVDMVLNMAGRTSWTMANTLVALVVMVGLDLWLIPSLGILGAAIGWSVSRVLANVVPLALVGLVVRVHPFGRPLTTAALLALGCFAVTPVLARWLFGATWAGLLVSCGLAGACYLVGLVRLRGPLELAALAGLGRRGRG
jgi:O-antigen/teichoic acid export membrane protein